MALWPYVEGNKPTIVKRLQADTGHEEVGVWLCRPKEFIEK
jgi:hypothetical protein